MRKTLLPILAAAFVLSLHPVAAQAYIGPGVGAGAIAAVVGVLGSIFLAIVAVIYYPIKRMMKGKKKGGAAASAAKVRDAK